MVVKKLEKYPEMISLNRISFVLPQKIRLIVHIVLSFLCQISNVKNILLKFRHQSQVQCKHQLMKKEKTNTKTKANEMN